MGGDVSGIDNTIYVPPVERAKLDRAKAVVLAFRNFSVSEEPHFSGSKQLLVRHRGFLSFAFGQIAAELTIENDSSTIRIEKDLNARLSDQFQKLGYKKQEISYHSPSVALRAFPMLDGFISDRPEDNIVRYDVHQKDFRDENSFLQELNTALLILGGKKRPERRLQLKP